MPVKPTMPRLFIFGCGYVGSAIAEAALARGWQVTALTRNEAILRRLQAGGLQACHTDLAQDGWQSQLKGDCDAAVFCLAADRSQPDAYREGYVRIQQRVLEYLAHSSCRCYLYTGSTGVYPHTDGQWVSEADAGHGELSASAHILLEAEALAATFSHAWRVLRLAGIYGPGRHYLWDRLRSGSGLLAGRGDYFVNLAHREDIVSAILVALEQGAEDFNGCYNVSDGKPALRQDIAAWLCQQAGLPAPRFDPAMPGARASFRQSGTRPPHRRIRNDLFCQRFGWQPHFEDFRAGYAPILACHWRAEQSQ